MHSCPVCDQACYCDMEDHENSAAADDCIHCLDEDDIECAEGDLED